MMWGQAFILLAAEPIKIAEEGLLPKQTEEFKHKRKSALDQPGSFIDAYASFYSLKECRRFPAPNEVGRFDVEPQISGV
jgi:hypothetical protein